MAKSKYVGEIQELLGITADKIAGKDFDAAIDELGGLHALGEKLTAEASPLPALADDPLASVDTQEPMFNQDLLDVSEADLGKTEKSKKFMKSLRWRY